MNYSSATGRQLRAERRKARVVFYGLSLILLLYLLMSLVFGERGVLTYMKLAGTHKALKGQLARLQEENTMLKKEIELLQSPDSFLLEKKAREELNMTRPDEYLFIFRDEDRAR